MMRMLCAAMLLLPRLGGGQGLVESDPARRAFTIDAAVVAIANETPLWPTFEPARIPLAIFTGDRTYLFRHPAVPAEFVTLAGVTSMPGRHPAVTSNSSAMIGGVPTATVLADGAQATRSVRTLAAVALHEAFHVHQRERHPTWQGNEGDLFTYPVDRADLLTDRRLESEHLRRALATSGASRACHAHRALVHRHRRFGAMSAAHVAYERRSELNEGLATYVQLLAQGERSVSFPDEPFAPDAVRDRFYVVGPAWAFLLDALSPGWQAVLAQHDSLDLDTLLDRGLSPEHAAGDCDLDVAQQSDIASRARRDVAALTAGRARARAAFDSTAGWRIVIEADPGAPLWPQGFDPLNVTLVADGLLHHRFLTLGNDAGQVTMIDGGTAELAALSVAAGEHPLFHGVRRVTIAGLAEPTVVQRGGGLEVTAPGLTLTFRGARTAAQERTLLITLGSEPTARP